MFYILHFIIAQFTMPKVFYCSKCALQYSQPVGKKCQYEGEWKWLHHPSTETAGNATVSQQILLQLQQLGDKMDFSFGKALLTLKCHNNPLIIFKLMPTRTTKYIEIGTLKKLFLFLCLEYDGCLSPNSIISFFG